MKSQTGQVAGVCLLLALAVMAVFGQTAGFEFVNYDDNTYVFENPVVQNGLTLKGVAWAFTYGEIGHWHPLTWLTHMADCQVYGLKAGGHHVTNVALHAAAVMLLFLALRELTGSLWRSAFVAAVFGVHPLRVESVAWIAERKDVLSGVFFMLTLWAYARYARRPTRARYAAVMLAYALGLLSKNSLVTLPFVLLLLDGWPLHRLTLSSDSGPAEHMAVLGRLVKEKIPLFLLSAGSCVATFLVPEKVGSNARLPLLERLENAVVCYGTYLWQTVFPTGLAIPYLNPPNGVPIRQVVAALVVLAVISMMAVKWRHNRPFVLVGWLWYLGMLVPMSGIIQMSLYASHSDRYTYLPGIGLVMAGTWLAGEGSLGWKHRRAALGGLAGALLAALMVCAWNQTACWKNSETLWEHTLRLQPDNYVAHYNLGETFRRQGKLDEAITQYQEALETKPNYGEAHNNLGTAFNQKGRVDEAISQFQLALETMPNNESIHFNLAKDLYQTGRVGEAITQFQSALQIQPADTEAQNNLAWLLATAPQSSLRDGERAARLARQANELSGGKNPVILGTLAAALAETGRFGEAAQTAQKAMELARAQGRPDWADKINRELQRYQAGLPLHP